MRRFSLRGESPSGSQEAAARTGRSSSFALETPEEAAANAALLAELSSHSVYRRSMDASCDDDLGGAAAPEAAGIPRRHLPPGDDKEEALAGDRGPGQDVSGAHRPATLGNSKWGATEGAAEAGASSVFAPESAEEVPVSASSPISAHGLSMDAFSSDQGGGAAPEPGNMPRRLVLLDDEEEAPGEAENRKPGQETGKGPFDGLEPDEALLRICEEAAEVWDSLGVDHLLGGVRGTRFQRLTMLLVGQPGAGKSTLMNYLSGVTFERTLDERGQGVLVPNPKNQRLVAAVGHSDAVAQTVVPQVVQMVESGVSLIDTAGFKENRGPAMELVSSRASALAAALYPPAIDAVLVVLDCQMLFVDRCSRLTELAAVLRRMIPGWLEGGGGGAGDPRLYYVINKLADGDASVVVRRLGKARQDLAMAREEGSIKAEVWEERDRLLAHIEKHHIPVKPYIGPGGDGRDGGAFLRQLAFAVAEDPREPLRSQSVSQALSETMVAKLVSGLDGLRAKLDAGAEFLESSLGAAEGVAENLRMAAECADTAERTRADLLSQLERRVTEAERAYEAAKRKTLPDEEELEKATRVLEDLEAEYERNQKTVASGDDLVEVHVFRFHSNNWFFTPSKWAFFEGELVTEVRKELVWSRLKYEHGGEGSTFYRFKWKGIPNLSSACVANIRLFARRRDHSLFSRAIAVARAQSRLLLAQVLKARVDAKRANIRLLEDQLAVLVAEEPYKSATGWEQHQVAASGDDFQRIAGEARLMARQSEAELCNIKALVQRAHQRQSHQLVGLQPLKMLDACGGEVREKLRAVQAYVGRLEASSRRAQRLGIDL